MRAANREWETLIEVFNRMKSLFLITDHCPLPAAPKSSPGRTGEFLPVVSGQDSVVSTQTARSIANRCNFSCLTIVSGFLLFVLFVPLSLTAQPARKKNAPPADAPITPEEAAKLEAVIKTELGAMRMEFYPDKAPLHVSSFIKNARTGVYDGTSFFRVFVHSLVQGGDPTMKESLPRNRWGAGALNLLKDEFSDLKHERGTVSAVRIPDKPNSGGAQFFLCAAAQPQLDGKYSAFARINEGLEIIEQISLTPADDKNFTLKPVRIISITFEPKRTEPFKDAAVAEMRKEVLLRTTLGDFTLALDPDLAPEHVRNFLKLVETGWFDHTAFHRIIPGFVIQGGIGYTREPNKTHPADRWVHKLNGEFSKERKHLRGSLSMAHSDDPNSAETSFFIVLREAQNLDGKFTIFGKVVDGFETLDRIEQVPRNGESPVGRIELIEATIKP